MPDDETIGIPLEEVTDTPEVATPETDDEPEEESEPSVDDVVAVDPVPMGKARNQGDSGVTVETPARFQ